MPEPSFWARLRGARVVRVLVVYLGATWVVLQLVDTLVGLLSLPEWVGPVAVVLLAVGLVVVLATAWVQSLPATTAAEEAGEIPTDWQVAPGDVLASLKAGRLPHLTWGRVIMGGVVALSLLIGVAGGYVFVTGKRAPGFGPADLGAGEAAAGIAVLPFDVTGGSDLDLWREGMVDVLSTNLDGMGGFRTIDSRTVMARWHEKGGDAADADLRTELAAAGSTGARFGLVGNLVGNPGGVRISADVYDLASGDKITQSYVEGPADSVLALVSRLSVDVVRDMLAADGQQLMQAPRTAGITTESLEALRHYLDGMAAYRRSDFPASAAAFEKAVEADSTFAMAWYGLSSAYGWMENLGSEVSQHAAERAMALSDRLPLRERTLMTAAARGLNERDLSALDDLRQATAKYPDDPEVWFETGEFYRHVGIAAGVATESDALQVFGKAVALDPTFGPYYIHYIESLLGEGRRQDAAQALQRYEALAGGKVEPHLKLALALFGGDEAVRDSTLAHLDTVPEVTLRRLQNEIPFAEALTPDEVLPVFQRALAVSRDGGWANLIAQTQMRQGRVHDLLATAAAVPDAAKVNFVAAMSFLRLPLPAEFQGMDLNVCPDRDDAGEGCMFNAGAVAAFRGDRSTWKKWVDRNHALGKRYGEEGQAAHGREHEALAVALEGLWADLQGKDPDAAAQKLASGSQLLPDLLAYFTRLELAHVQAGLESRTAATTLSSMLSGPLAPYAATRLGAIREQLGDTAGAREAYRRAVDSFVDADPDLSYAVQAREGLARVSAN